MRDLARPPDTRQPARRAAAAPWRAPVALAEWPPNPVPEAPPAPGRAHGIPPFGAWTLNDCRPSRLGWHIACPACVEGRVLLVPDPDDAFEYLLRPNTCTAGCDPFTVVRWWAFREGDMSLWFGWLDRQRRQRTRHHYCSLRGRRAA